MRNRAFRLFVAALLALLIPIQGIGAITTGVCMSLEHHQGAPSDAHDGHGHEGHDHASHSGGHAADSHSHSDADVNTGSHCGPCTACCASATIAGVISLSLGSPASHAPYAFSQSLPPSVQLDGLDRPPLAL